MQDQGRARRAHGTGSLFVYRGAWYGQWRQEGRQVKRKVGPKRRRGSTDGLTRSQAEVRLRRMMEDATPPAPVERITLSEAGRRYVDRLEAMGRKRSTVTEYRSYMKIHLGPALGTRSLVKITRADVQRLIDRKLQDGAAPKSVCNYVGLLHGIFVFAEKQGWVSSNPVKLVEKPRSNDIGTDPDIRFLTIEEVEKLLRQVPEDRVGRMEKVLYLTAVMTGLRQGELLALRWRDIDWTAMRVRVRRNFVRGEYGTPKSRRGSRSVPLADRVGTELERHFKQSDYQQQDSLVFCHPSTGSPYDRSRLLKRFKGAVKRAGVGRFEEVRRSNGVVDLRPLTRFHDLRHTFGTRVAAAGVPMRTLQEWMGHRDFKTTLIYTDYAPGEHEAALVAAAFEGIRAPWVCLGRSLNRLESTAPGADRDARIENTAAGGRIDSPNH